MHHQKQALPPQSSSCRLDIGMVLYSQQQQTMEKENSTESMSSSSSSKEESSKSDDKSPSVAAAIVNGEEASSTKTAARAKSAAPRPRPPMRPPDVSVLTNEYKNIKAQQFKTAVKIEQLTNRVSDLQEQLVQRQKELSGNQTSWKQEKQGFLDKIAKLTGLVEEKTQELDQQKISVEEQEEELYRRQKLESEVQL